MSTTRNIYLKIILMVLSEVIRPKIGIGSKYLKSIGEMNIFYYKIIHLFFLKKLFSLKMEYCNRINKAYSQTNLVLNQKRHQFNKVYKLSRKSTFLKKPEI
jgi:hypothetical protein